MRSINRKEIDMKNLEKLSADNSKKDKKIIVRIVCVCNYVCVLKNLPNNKRILHRENLSLVSLLKQRFTFKLYKTEINI